jgi:flagellar capping protein FliD
MSNRVEELESKVSELQAAVNGLTEELVETKERVRELEEQRGVTADVEAEEGEDSSVSTGSEAEIIEPTPGADGTGDVEDGAEADDEAKGDEGEEETTGEDGESDIIVA